MTSRPRGGAKVDIESLERDNDRDVGHLSEKVGLLKSLTQGIKSEVDSQHSILDNMDSGMFSARGMLGSVNEKFRMVLNDKSGSKTMIAIVGSIVGIVLLWYFMKQ